MNPTWSEAFKAYLDEIGLTQQDALFALRKARIKATASQISCWARYQRPHEQTRQKLERWSGGKIKAELPSARESSATPIDDSSRHAIAG